MRHSVIAHISDLHFGRHDEKAVAALRQDLIEIRPDFLVASGDLSERGSVSELEQARDFLLSVQGGLAQAGHTCQVIVVPGNHDLGIVKRRKSWNEVFEGKFTNSSMGADLSPEELSICEAYPEAGIVFLKFDSNFVGRWPLDIARGMVGLPQIQKARDVLARLKASSPSFSRCHLVAVVHHHLQYLPETEADSLLLMKDAGDFWRALLDMDVELVLHGHKHYAAPMVLKHYHLGEEKALAILAAGSSCGLSQPRGQSCSFFLIHCEPLKFRVWKRQLSGSIFKADGGKPIEFFHLANFQIPGVEHPIDTRALSLIIHADEDEIDKVHCFSLIKIEAQVDADRNYIGRYTFVGSNHSDKLSKFFPVPLVIVGAPVLSDLSLKVTDLRTGKILPPPEVQFTQVNKLLLRVYFDQPIIPQGELSIQVDFRLRGVMYPEGDYDAFGFSRFWRKVERFEYSFRSAFTLVGPQLYSIYLDGIVDDLGAMQKREEGSEYVWTQAIETPKSLGILFFYERIVGL